MSQVLSGIASLSSQPGRSQGRNPLTEYFKEILKKSGVVLSSGEDPNYLTQEQSLVVRDIQKLLQENNAENNIERFFKGLKVLVKKDKYMVKALLPTLLKTSDDRTHPNCKQDSLFRIFLKVDVLQEQTLNIILEQIASSVSDANDTSRLWHLLTQLRYLPNIKNSQALATQLLDVIDISTLPAQTEILYALPEILPDQVHEKAAEELNNIIHKNEDLTCAIINCLNEFNLESETRSQLQTYILSSILLGTNVKNFPILLDFILTDCKMQNVTEILMKIRNALDKIMASNAREDVEKQSGKIVCFTRLEDLTLIKNLVTPWLGLLGSIKLHTDHKPIDLLIIFILHSSGKVKKRIVENFVRKKVKTGQMKTRLVEELFERYISQQLLRQYMSTILQIGCHLIRTSKDQTVTEFATVFFKELFINEHTEKMYRKDIIEYLVTLLNNTNGEHATPILNVFFTFIHEKIDLVQSHAIIFFSLLEKLDSFTVKEVKMLFEILCKLTCSDDSLSYLKEEIHMIVRKQLCNSNRNDKYRAVITAIVLVKYITSTEEDRSEVSIDETITLAQLKGRAKEAASIMELARSSARNFGELLSLYYDQLAWLLYSSDKLDNHFLYWLYETETAGFQENFTTNTICEPVNDLQFSMQFNLNRAKETQETLAINIGGLVTGDSAKISILPSHFRVLRMLHHKQHAGDLETINALLGCGVILPNLDSIDSFDSEQTKIIADCIFHCINWFRELINAFVGQKKYTLKRRVLSRLANVIELEAKLEECLTNCPEHKLPQSHFNSQPEQLTAFKEPKRPKKKARLELDETAAASTSKKKETKPSNSQHKEVEFREIDTDVTVMLIYPVRSTDEDDNGGELTLSLPQVNFLLKDVVKKLQHFVNGRQDKISNLDMVHPKNFFTDCVRLLKPIAVHLNRLNEQIKTLIASSEGELDGPELYTEQAKRLKQSFGLIMELLAVLFNWSGFTHSKNTDLLKECLQALNTSTSQTWLSSNKQITELADKLTDLTPHCLQLKHGIDLVETLKGLHKITTNDELKSKIAKTSGKLLEYKWCNNIGTYDSGKLHSANIETLVKSFLINANIKTINGLVGTLQNQIQSLEQKQHRLEMLPSIDRANVYIFYRNLWNALHERLKIELDHLTNHQHLVLWKNVTSTMEGLMDILETHLKVQKSHSMLLCYMKKSIAVLKIFISHGIPMLEIMLKSKTDEVISIFKNMQKSTRFVHRISCHTKARKDVSLMAYVPQFSAALENFILRVKGVLLANDCSEAFKIGNLRNRDIDGADILTQFSDSSVETNEDEEIPEADDSNEEDETTNTDGAQSESEVYD